MTCPFSSRKTFGTLGLTAAALSLAAGVSAQSVRTTQTVPGSIKVKVTTTQLKGEVVYVQADYLVAKMIPGGDSRLFVLQPGKMATIDGVEMPLNQVKIGTVLTASVTVTEKPMVDRTTDSLRGTVSYASPTTVILTLENGENRQYEVPKGFKVNVEGHMREAKDLRPGMKITATKIVEAPRTELSTTSVITGVGPKK